MKLSVPFSATVGAVLTTLFIQNATHAIVATDNTALYNQQVESGQYSGVVALQTYNPLESALQPLMYRVAFARRTTYPDSSSLFD